MTAPTTAQSPAPGSDEIELRLAVDPADIGRLRAWPDLAEAGNPTAGPRRVQTYYFDTPDFRLYGRGVALRLRLDGGRWSQGIKAIGGASPGDAVAVAAHREWEWPIGDGSLNLPLLDQHEAGALVPSDIRDALSIVFSTDFERSQTVLRPDPRTVVEVAIDEGHIAAGPRRARLCEVELELKAGNVGRLFDLALAAHRVVPLRIETESKAERAYHLATGRLPTAAPPEPLGLSPLNTVAEAFRHILRHCLRQWLANEPCVLIGADADGLRQIGAALTRLRIAFAFFDLVTASDTADGLKRDVRRLSRRLRSAHAWAVLTTRVVEPLTARDGAGRPWLARLVEAADGRRAVSARTAAATIVSPQGTGLLLALSAWLEDGRWHTDAPAPVKAALDLPMTTLAGPWLATCHRRVRKALRAIDAGNGTAEDLKRLRRRLRHLCCAVEFFRGLYAPPAARPYGIALTALAGNIDALHETTLSRRRLDKLAPPARAGRAAARVLDQATSALRATLATHSDAFRAIRPFWE